MVLKSPQLRIAIQMITYVVIDNFQFIIGPPKEPCFVESVPEVCDLMTSAGEARLQCKIDGSPVPQIAWYVNYSAASTPL